MYIFVGVEKLEILNVYKLGLMKKIFKNKEQLSRISKYFQCTLMIIIIQTGLNQNVPFHLPLRNFIWDIFSCFRFSSPPCIWKLNGKRHLPFDNNNQLFTFLNFDGNIDRRNLYSHSHSDKNSIKVQKKTSNCQPTNPYHSFLTW